MGGGKGLLRKSTMEKMTGWPDPGKNSGGNWETAACWMFWRVTNGALGSWWMMMLGFKPVDGQCYPTEVRPAGNVWASSLQHKACTCETSKCLKLRGETEYNCMAFENSVLVWSNFIWMFQLRVLTTSLKHTSQILLQGCGYHYTDCHSYVYPRFSFLFSPSFFRAYLSPLSEDAAE